MVVPSGSRVTKTGSTACSRPIAAMATRAALVMPPARPCGSLPVGKTAAIRAMRPNIAIAAIIPIQASAGSHGASSVPMSKRASSGPRPSRLNATAISRSSQPIDVVRASSHQHGADDRVREEREQPRQIGQVQDHADDDERTEDDRRIRSECRARRVGVRVTAAHGDRSLSPDGSSLRTGAVKVRRADRIVALLRTFRQ